MYIACQTVGPFYENTYVIINKSEALLIDPGFTSQNEFAWFSDLMMRYGVKAYVVVLTHAHIDHIIGFNYLPSDITVYMYKNDMYHWHRANDMARLFDTSIRLPQKEPKPLPISKNYSIGTHVFDVLYVPGHAPEHICLYFAEQNVVIAGDTLFKDGVGRYDLYKGNWEELQKNIKMNLFTLPDCTRVLPGHGNETTIGYEKKHNPFFS